MERGASLGTRIGNVRFGSKADIGVCVRDVRFTPDSGHAADRQECPLSAKSGHSTARVALRHRCQRPTATPIQWLASVAVGPGSNRSAFAPPVWQVGCLIIPGDMRFRDDMRSFVDARAKKPEDKLLATFDYVERWFKEKTFFGCPFKSAVGEFGDTDSEVFQEAATHKHLVVN